MVFLYRQEDLEFQEDEFFAFLEKRFQCRFFAHRLFTEYYYDSFDWRLFRKKSVLKRIGNRYSLLACGKENYFMTATGHRRNTLYAADFNEACFAEKLKSILAVRAASMCARVQCEEYEVALKNEDRKTVVRLVVKTRKVMGIEEENVLPISVEMYPIRGYDKQRKLLTDLLEENNFHLCENYLWEYKTVLEETDNRPDPKTYRKLHIPLKRKNSLNNSLAQISRELIHSVERQFGGVLKDVDSEFLHDFRIGVRRIRSLLSIMKKELPVESCCYFSNEFRWLASLTGPVRDLDVYLLKKKEYEKYLPAELHEGVQLFFELLEKERVTAFNDMKLGLKSKRYQQLLDDWNLFVVMLESGINKQGLANGKEVVCSYIKKRYSNMIKHGKRITEDTDDAVVHALRIRAKKLRYLLEFFRTYYDKEVVKKYLKQMRKLQDNLGDFNDISVQQEMLVDYQSNIRAGSKKVVKLSASLGGLIQIMAERKKEIRNEFSKTFVAFTAKENKQLMAALIES